MILEQYYLNCLAHASYLIGDRETCTAAVVDPQRDVERYLEAARLQGLQIRHVFLSHFHADFIAGHLELRDRTGAKIYLGAQAQAEYAFTPMKHGDTLEFGKVRLKVFETPGHTPESISILVYDLEKDERHPYIGFGVIPSQTSSCTVYSTQHQQRKLRLGKFCSGNFGHPVP